MIIYYCKEEKAVAIYLAEELENQSAKSILLKGYVSSAHEAQILSKFFWQMVDTSAAKDIYLPCDGSLKFWTEKLYNSLGAYLESAGYENEWNDEIDRA